MSPVGRRTFSVPVSLLTRVGQREAVWFVRASYCTSFLPARECVDLPVQAVATRFTSVAGAGKQRLTSCEHCDTVNTDWLFVSILERALQV